MKTINSILRRFTRRQDGGATVEFVLWFPFMFGLMLVISEVSLVYYGQNQVLRVTQDATRQISIGKITKPEELHTYITTRLSKVTDSAVIKNGVETGVITTTVTVPVNDLAPFGFFPAIAGAEITVVAQQVAERVAEQ